jgi:hypothetical protein
MQAAIEEGKAQGKAEGKAEEKVNTIRLLEGLLRMETTSMTELQGQSLDDLDRRITDLQLHLRNRIG